jgi:hypothetical protein
MADYYACTELEPLLDEIRKLFAQAEEQQEPLSLSLSNTGEIYPYVLRTKGSAEQHRVHKVAGKALDILRNGMETVAATN